MSEIYHEGYNDGYHEGYNDGYHECLNNVCKYIKDNEEMFEDSFSDINDLIDLIKEAVDEEIKKA